MSQYAFDVTTAEFESKVIEASRQAPVLVDFWAPWCGPCKSLGPVLEKLAAEYDGRFLLAKVNSDDNQELARRYGVRGIPNVKAFVGGELVDEFTGALPESAVREFLRQLTPSPAEPVRQHALAAAGNGEMGRARELLEKAIAMDPELEAARLDLAELALNEGKLEEAQRVLDALPPIPRDEARVESLAARLQLAAMGGGEPAELARKLAGNPDDLQTRLALANALAVRHDYREALEHLLEIVRRDRGFGDDIGRKTMVRLFTLLAADPGQEELMREYRLKLARTIN